MYQVGQYIVYGFEGVCRVEAIGPVDIKGTRQDVDYYTLTTVYQNGKLYIPVESGAYSRPVITREQADQLIADMPNIDAEVIEINNVRLLTERYQAFLKSNDCREWVKLIRSIRAKCVKAAEKGRRLGQVDERCLKQAEEKLHAELAIALDIPVKEVRDYITKTLEK